ncbi:MAG: hypothetical protein ABSD72_02855 [Terracidiphilus sp.]
MMNRASRVDLLSIVSLFVSVLLAGCGSPSISVAPQAPLSSKNLNLIFVASEDLAYNSAGDMNPITANLSNRGLQRSLLMGTFLQHKVLGGNNVTGIYALEPMTHLQTANNYPDMVGLETIQQFAMLNQISLSSPPVGAFSYPISASYASGPLPAGVAQPVLPCPACQGLDFNDENGDNEALVSGILQANAPGYYVFSAPWETISALMTNINQLEGYKVQVPSAYAGPNSVYAISLTPQGSANFNTYDSKLIAPATYPVLPSPVPTNNACTTQTPFSIALTGGSGGAQIPTGINTNETVYFIRHAEAHPTGTWDDGNYVGAGQWRALALASALRGKIQPNQVISVDPAVGMPLGVADVASSYVRAALTVEPYAIANNLPFNLAADIPVLAQNPPKPATYTSTYFFTGGKFSNQTLLVAWEHERIGTTIAALLASYQSSQPAPVWPDDDYDGIWTVTLDAEGNLTANNNLCEGINSAALPVAPPQF